MIRYVTAVMLAASIVAAPSSGRAQAADPDPARFAADIRTFRQWDEKNAVPQDGVLFVGSSSIRLWASASKFPGLPIINRGFGGSHISDVHHYIEDVALKYRPAVVVFYAGENDIASGKTPERVRDDFRAFALQMLKVRSDARIIFISIKPSPARWALWPAMREANERIRSYIQGYSEQSPRLFYADVAQAMLSADGSTRSELYVEDGIHMTEAGYAIWERVLTPVLSSARTSR